MKLLDLLLTVVVIGLLAAMLGPRLVAAKRSICNTWANINMQHNERLDYLSSGALEDPKAHFTTEKDTEDSLQYYTTIQFTKLQGLR